MTAAEFAVLLATQRPALRPRTAEACRLVLLDGMTGYAAAKQAGVAKSTVGRALARLTHARCPSCGQALPQAIAR